jgi:N-acetylneuraminate synthase
MKLAVELGMHCFSTPFDATAVDYLEATGVPAYKIASFELVDLPLIEQVARTGKPMIMSTGMATLSEIDDAVRAARVAGARELALLKCTSAYPSPLEEMNLRTIPHLAEAFQVPTGLSDHTLDVAVPVAAVALGACIIEKHLTLSRATPGPDASFSLEPEEFRRMTQAVRSAERALGQVSYEITPRELATRAFRRSLFAVERILAGEPLTAANVRSIRPSGGLPPKYLTTVLGRCARVEIARGTPLTWDLITSP